jgi:NADPH:quinone reductase-like Zn-dependent oxidoreductase
LEVTGLGIGDKSLDEDRNLFFRIHWQEAFSLQGLVNNKSSFSDIGDLLEVYAHQFPAAKLLHVTPGLLQTQKVLAKIATPENRQIQSISLLAADEVLPALNEQLDDLFPGLRQDVDFTNGQFDFAVLEERRKADTLSLVKDGGFLVTLTDLAEKGLQKLFSAGQWTVWQKVAAEREQPIKENLHLIISSKPSTETLAIAAAIKARSPGTQTTTLEAIPKEATRIISLVNLDEDVLYDASSERPAQFDAVRALFVSESLKIVWLLSGATQEPVRPAQALFTGLARAARSENEDLHLVTLDVSDSSDAKAIGDFAVHVLDPSVGEDELRVSNNRLFIPRVLTDDQLNRKLPNGPGRQPTQQAFTQDKVLALDILRTPGQADSIVYTDGHGSITDEVDDQEVELRVSASAISDRDEAIVAGTLHDSHLGETAVGFVTRIGAQVDGSKIRVGDRIFVFSPQGGAHRSLLRLPEKLAFAIPGEISDTDAVALGHNLLIAHYALLDIAHLRADEQCLVLGGASGLAQVAVQLVEAVGARALTAVPTSKASKINVILRTDASTPFTHEFWDVLAIGGRIIDLAATSAPWNAGALLPGFSYTAVDLAAASRQDDTLGPRLVESVFELFQKQTFSTPSPVTTFGYGEVSQALRHSRSNAGDGQVVLFERPGEQVAVAPPTYSNSQALFQSNKTYLIVGGLGGIGRALSQWMFRRGARQFAFLSRSGARKAEAKETVNWLEHRKATVNVYSGDVTSEKDVRDCVHLIGDSLRGVIQAAMVLESGPLSEMTAGQWASVIRPKVYGAENLHHATKELPLDFFICFSSISAIIGFMAEANYSASNAYLDAFVRWRLAQGLPGFAMNVGVVADAGAIAEDANLRAIIDRIGMDVLTEEELFFQIEEAINGQLPFSQGPLDGWTGDRHQLLSGINTRRTDLFWSKKPLFRNLYAGRSQKSTVSGNSEEQQLSELLQQAGGSDKMFPVLLDAFSDRIASSLAVPRSIVQAGVPLAAYGMDSLVAVEFRKWFSKEVGVNLALFDILGSKSTGDLVAKVCDLIEANDSLKGSGANNTQAASSENTQASTVAKTSHVIPIANPRPAQIPMSTFQRRLWFMHNLTADSASLNVSVSLIIDGTPKLSILERVWQELGRRNESLRTAFFEGDDFAEQEIVEDGLIPIEQADVSNTSDPAESLRSFAAALRQKPLDIEIGQLIRSALVKFEESRYAWVLSIHHMAIDGGSKASLMGKYISLFLFPPSLIHGNLIALQNKSAPCTTPLPVVPTSTQ